MAKKTEEDVEIIYRVDSFSQFQEVINSLRGALQNDSLLFRGQSLSKWNLDTTFERWLVETPGYFSINGYYKLVLRIKDEIETFTGKSWPGESDPNSPEYQFKEFDDLFKPLPLYSYLIYLRHHGFPSPLLDWSKSEYVAAFFALKDELVSDDEYAAIYAFCERPNLTKLRSSDEPNIRGLGPHSKSHPRHFTQKSQYTVCMELLDGQWSFVPHHKVFDNPKRTKGQDLLSKIFIKRECRNKFLTELDKFNLNAYSLFQTEESMLDVMAFRLKSKLMT